MKTLHLIVHEELLHEMPNFADADMLDRIDKIKKNEKNVAYIPWFGGDNTMTFDFAYFALPAAKGFDLVILYGISRVVCVDSTAEILQEAGIPTAYDIVGTS